MSSCLSESVAEIYQILAGQFSGGGYIRCRRDYCSHGGFILYLPVLFTDLSLIFFFKFHFFLLDPVALYCF
ncbi:hypothetical protein Hanom_Chr05g00402281 [Helianthus anomalus]